MDKIRQSEVIIQDNTEIYPRKLFLESYGCQMNFSDSEIVASILSEKGFSTTTQYAEADVILLNTCAIRENAEQKVRQRLHDFKKLKKKNPELIVGVLGCMAERLKANLLEEEKLVDLVVGPDAYRDLPDLIERVESGQKTVNVLLSKEETYADINPVRLNSNGIIAFISIMRGCDNMCSFCVVPFTRGRERSRDPESIIKEVKELYTTGYREVTLLGQNVDSYLWIENKSKLKKENLSIEESKKAITFAQLLEKVALVNPNLRVRFSTSNPKDMTDDVLYVISKYDNICKYIHLPVQSGNTRILKLMNRGYTREWYLERINAIRTIVPDSTISTDIITGFCSETEEEHQDTLSLMTMVKFDFAYMFKYSERPGTLAARRYKDDIPDEIKSRRLTEIINLQQKMSYESNLRALNKTHRVLVEGISKKSDLRLYGRNTQNAVVVFPKGNLIPGDYANVLITDCTPATLLGKIIR